MNNQKPNRLSTDPYKGVRDFYPEDMAVQNYIFSVWREVVESFGYREYSASILEPAELYRAKSGEEIVNEQTYTFTDRGNREVTLRPEMTPTVARMVAGRRRELSFPLRWYSIPNLFRYERPQRGRLREHWQLNVDLFGLNNIESDIEILTIAHEILKKFSSANPGSDMAPVINISHALLLRKVLQTGFDLDETETAKVIKILDKYVKGDETRLTEAKIEDVIGLERGKKIPFLLSSENLEKYKEYEHIKRIYSLLMSKKIRVKINPFLTRGFDYYTGMIFEIFDTGPENRRSLFGGGRYDELVNMFDQDTIPAVGFGMGDVTIRDVLETYDLIPDHIKSSKTNLYIATLAPEYAEHTTTLAENLRKQKIRVAVDYTYKKPGDQVSKANKDGIPFVIVIGEEEIKNGQYKLKNLKTGEENVMKESELAKHIKRET